MEGLHGPHKHAGNRADQASSSNLRPRLRPLPPASRPSEASPRQRCAGQVPGLWQGCVPLCPFPLLQPWPRCPRPQHTLRPPCLQGLQRPPARPDTNSSLHSVQKTHPRAWDLRVPLTLRLSQDLEVTAGVLGESQGATRESDLPTLPRDGASSRAGPASWLLGGVQSQLFPRAAWGWLPLRKPSCRASRGCREPACYSGTAPQPRDAWQQLKSSPGRFPHCSAPL